MRATTRPPLKPTPAATAPLLISIEGNIGIGKSTLMRELKTRYAPRCPVTLSPTLTPTLNLSLTLTLTLTLALPFSLTITQRVRHA